MTKKPQITFDRCRRVLAFLQDHDPLWNPGDPVRGITSSLSEVSLRLAESSTHHLLLEQRIREGTRQKNAALQRLLEQFGAREAELVAQGAQPGVLDGVRTSLEEMKRARNRRKHGCNGSGSPAKWERCELRHGDGFAG